MNDVHVTVDDDLEWCVDDFGMCVGDDVGWFLDVLKVMLEGVVDGFDWFQMMVGDALMIWDDCWWL